MCSSGLDIRAGRDSDGIIRAGRDSDGTHPGWTSGLNIRAGHPDWTSGLDIRAGRDRLDPSGLDGMTG